MTAENPEAFSRETFIYFFGGEHCDMYFFLCIIYTKFSSLLKQNVKYIFIDAQRRK